MVTSRVELGSHEGTQLGPSETSNGPSKYPPLASFGVVIVEKSGEDGPERPTSSTYTLIEFTGFRTLQALRQGPDDRSQSCGARLRIAGLIGSFLGGFRMAVFPMVRSTISPSTP